MVLEDEHGQSVDGRSQRRRLLEDVDAVLLALDHPGDPANLSLDPAESPDELGLVLRYEWRNASLPAVAEPWA